MDGPAQATYPSASVYDISKVSPSGVAPVSLANYNGSVATVVRPEVFVGKFITVHGVDSLLVTNELGIGALPGIGTPELVYLVS